MDGLSESESIRKTAGRIDSSYRRRGGSRKPGLASVDRSRRTILYCRETLPHKRILENDTVSHRVQNLRPSCCIPPRRLTPAAELRT